MLDPSKRKTFSKSVKVHFWRTADEQPAQKLLL